MNDGATGTALRSSNVIVGSIKVVADEEEEVAYVLFVHVLQVELGDRNSINGYTRRIRLAVVGGPRYRLHHTPLHHHYLREENEAQEG